MRRQGCQLGRKLLGLAGSGCDLERKAGVLASHDRTLDAAKLAEIHDYPFSEVSAWEAAQKYSSRRDVFGLAGIVAAAFEDVMS